MKQKTNESKAKNHKKVGGGGPRRSGRLLQPTPARSGSVKFLFGHCFFFVEKMTFQNFRYFFSAMCLSPTLMGNGKTTALDMKKIFTKHQLWFWTEASDTP